MAKQTEKSKTKTSTGPYKPTQPQLQNEINTISSVPISNQPTAQQQWALQGLQNAAKVNAAYAPQQNQLIKNLYSGAGLGQGTGYINQAYNAASGALNPYLQAGYLDPASNPYLHQALGTLQNDIYNQTADKFQLAGRGFSGDFADALGRGYAAGLTPMLLGQYNTNVGTQQGAAGQLGSLAGAASSGLDAAALNKLNAAQAAAAQQAAAYAPYNASLAASQQAALAPYTSVGAQQQYLLPIAQLGSTGLTTGKTTTTVPDPSMLQSAVGAGAGAAGILGSTGAFGSSGWLASAIPAAASFSDRRLKDDIAQVGELYDGTPVYRFRYKGSSMTVIGLMADDVEKHTPEAVVMHSSGFKMVDYKRATERALQ